MAVAPFVRVETPGAIRNGDFLGYWQMTTGDTAEPLICPRFSDKSIHMFGTWGGGSVTLKGTNDPTLVSYDDIYDYAGDVITQTAAASPWIILPNVYALKPVLTGGSGVSLVLALMGRGII